MTRAAASLLFPSFYEVGKLLPPLPPPLPHPAFLPPLPSFPPLPLLILFFLFFFLLWGWGGGKHQERSLREDVYAREETSGNKESVFWTQAVEADSGHGVSILQSFCS